MKRFSVIGAILVALFATSVDAKNGVVDKNGNINVQNSKNTKIYSSTSDCKGGKCKRTTTVCDDKGCTTTTQ